MNGKVCKQIRNNMYYPRERKYQRKENGMIISDDPRRLYQSLKKKYLTMWKRRSKDAKR